MKKLLSGILCLLMLLSTAALLFSCAEKPDGEPIVGKNTAEVDLTDYAIVYDAELTVEGEKHVNRFATALNTLSGVTFRPQKASEGDEADTDTPEILIGNTTRTETQKALKKVKGEGWTVRVFDEKIVIVGTTPFLTRVALAWFTETYLNAEHVKESVLTLNKKVLVSDMETVSLTNAEGAGQYAVVYDDSVDDVKNKESYATDATPTEGGQETDYIYDLSGELRSMLADATGARSDSFAFKKASAAADTNEILVGKMKRAEMKKELSTLAANEYAVSVRDGKIMLAAWNDVALASAYILFEDMIAGCTQTDGATEKTVSVPANCTLRETLDNDWVVDFPKPEGEGIELDGTVDVDNNSLEYIYSGTGVSRDAYVAYCNTLEQAGFAAIAAETQWEGSSFRTYLNSESGVTLHVYHSAYTHAAEQGVKDTLNSIRIVASTTDDVTLPGADILTPQSYTTVTETMVTTVDLDYKYGDDSNFGLAQIITLADGSFIIIDGAQGRFTDDETNLWNILVNLYKKAHNGQAPTAKGSIHVRGWILTHEHGDHYGVFVKFLKRYGKNALFKFDYLLFNTASDSENYNSNNPSNAVQKDMNTLQNSVTGGFKYIKVHTGQVFYMANCRLEVLYTHEDIYPRKTEYFNNTTSVIRTVLTQTDGAGNSYETGCVWLGDVERIGSSRMRAMYGSFLQTEMVQVSHHASNGVEKELYNIIAPKVVWLPTDKARYQSWCVAVPTAKSDWRKHVDYNLCVEMTCVEMIVVADDFDTTLPIFATGLGYDSLFNAGTLEPVAPNGTVIIDKRSA